MKAFFKLFAALVAFVATLGMVGCSGDGIVEFQPQDELDKAALAVAKEKYPNEKFYRCYEAVYAKEDTTKGKVDFLGDYDYIYNFIFFKDKDDKDKRFIASIKCSSESGKCDFYQENEDKIGNAHKQGRTK